MAHFNYENKITAMLSLNLNSGSGKIWKKMEKSGNDNGGLPNDGGKHQQFFHEFAIFIDAFMKSVNQFVISSNEIDKTFNPFTVFIHSSVKCFNPFIISFNTLIESFKAFVVYFNGTLIFINEFI